MPTPGISIADIDRVLQDGFRFLRFPAPLESQFEADTGAKRSRFLLITGAITLIIFELFLVRDRLQLDDMFHQALIYRLAIVTPLALVMFAVLWRNPRPWIRESMEVFMTVLIAGGLLYMVGMSNSPLAAHAHYSMLLVLIFPNIVQRVRFWYAATASVIVVVAYALVVPHIRFIPQEVVFGAVLTLAMTTMLSLITNWKLEHDERRAYLVGLRETLRSQKLMVANEELSAISMLDPLTGLANRRRLEQFINALATSPRTALKRVVFIMLDIDHFKRFNDHYGHQAGDICLRMVAETLQQNLRAGSDLAVRLGGEELLAVLPDNDLDGGMQVAEHIRADVEGRGIAHANSTTAPFVTVSIGVAVIQPDTLMSFAEAMMAADEALYIAKQEGRNRVWPPLSASVVEQARQAG